MLRSKLEHKVLLIIIIALICGLGLSVVISIKRESDNLADQYRVRSLLFGDTLMTGFRNVMLSGRAGYVKQLIAEARAEFRDYGQLLLFDNMGKQIFAERGAFLTRPASEPRVAAIFQSQQSETFGHTRISTLLNEARCQVCHGAAEQIRGITWLSVKEEDTPAAPLMAGQILAAAFKQIMVSGQGELANTLLMDASDISGLTFAQVYDNAGYYPAFGDQDREVDEEALAAAITHFETNPNTSYQSASSGDDRVLFLPLPNEERCYVCHGDDHNLRGMLAMVYSKELDGMQSKSFLESNLRIAQESFATGFRSMMLAESGTHSGHYIDAVRQLPFVDSARLFARKKEKPVELYVPNRVPETTPSSIADSVQALIRKVNQAGIADEVPGQTFVEKRDGETFLVQIKAIKNELRCQACHTPPQEGNPNYALLQDRWKVRTIVAVSSPMTGIEKQISQNKRISIFIGLVTLFFVWLILHFFMKRYVIRPISAIGTTASEIGSGNLQARTQISSVDELGRLAGQINDMANGLRERFELTKFVSGETLDAVQTSEEGVQLGGERKLRTLFFSDIRGFTAYSEKVAPEQVISMLNTYLREQSYIVKEYGGDIDKFVGDELVATFADDGSGHEDNMVLRAIRCAYAIQLCVRELNQQYPDAPIGIGIGINTGPVVLGAMGSEERMDYTVLGDPVNVGARLCSAADAFQIILSEASYQYIKDRKDIQLQPLPPLAVKNKSEPLKVYEVRSVDLAQT